VKGKIAGGTGGGGGQLIDFEASWAGNMDDFALSISSDKTAICAGGIDSAPHQATITATLSYQSGEPVSGTMITFSLTNSHPDYPATIDPVSAATDSNGEAKATLTSSRKIGATVKVKAKYDEVEAETEQVTMEKATGAWSIDPQELIADGESQANVKLTLTYSGDSVDQHEMTWRISRIWDGNGTLIYQADPPSGSPSGYGSLNPTNDNTDGDGITETVYTVGTEAGTVEFEVLDESVVENSPASYKSTDDGNAQPTKFAVTEVKASNNVNIRLSNIPNKNVHDNILFKAQFNADGQLVLAAIEQPVCDARNDSFLSTIQISAWPSDRSFSGLTWRYTWTVHDGPSTVINENTMDGSGNTGQFSISTNAAVDSYSLTHQINIRQNNPWKSYHHDTSTLYQIFSQPPIEGENPPARLALSKACTYINGTPNTQHDCAAAIMSGIGIRFKPLGSYPSTYPLDAYDDWEEGVGCIDHANVLCCLLRSIGIGANTERWYGGEDNFLGKVWKWTATGKEGTILISPDNLWHFHVIAKTSDGRYDSALKHLGTPNILHHHPDYEVKHPPYGIYPDSGLGFDFDTPLPEHQWP